MDAVYGLPQNVPMYSDWQTKLFLYLLFLNFWRFTRMICHNLAFWIQNWKCGVNVVKWKRVLYLRNLPMFYPLLINIYTAFQIFATIPVTSCTCERSISVLRRLKTYLRSTMTETRLKGLALLNVHREIHLDTKEVITKSSQNDAQIISK